MRLRRFRRIDRVCSGHVHWHQSLHGCMYCSVCHVISASDMRLPCSPNVFQVSNIPSARMSGRQACRSLSLCKTVFPSLVICLPSNSWSILHKARCVFHFYIVLCDLPVLRLAAAARRRSRCTLERCHEGLHQRDVRLFASPLPHAFILTSSFLACESTRPCAQRQRKCWTTNGSLEL